MSDLLASLSPALKIGLGGLFFLSFASITNFVLHRVRPRSETFKKIRPIIRSWWIMVGILFAALLAGKIGFILLFALVSFLGFKEYLQAHAFEALGSRAACGYALIPLQCVLIYWDLEIAFLFFVPFLTLTFLPAFILASRRPGNLVEIISRLQTGLFLTVFLPSFLPGLFLIPHMNPKMNVDPLSVIVLLLVLTELNDVFQFICGKIWGRTKFVAEISPNKTLEGFVGGLVMTTVLTSILAPWLLQLSVWTSAFLGLAISIMGVTGDLVFSTLKRNLGVKDFSHMLPGHGGILDRVDSLVFTAPLTFYMLYVLY